jgi:hypothetical protein
MTRLLLMLLTLLFSLSGPAMGGIGGFGPCGLAANTAGRVEQYALTATESGFYPVMQRGFKQPQAGIWLDAGDVWKYGTTKNPTTRYSQSFLDKWGLQYEKQMGGTLQEALSSENSSILKYLDQRGTLPPGNKIIR